MNAWSSDMPDLRFVQTGSAILPHGADSAGSHTKQARVGDTGLHHPRATDCRNLETICERCGFFETGPQFLTILRRQHDHAADHNQPDPAQLFTEIPESVAWTGTPPAGALDATPVADKAVQWLEICALCEAHDRDPDLSNVASPNPMQRRLPLSKAPGERRGVRHSRVHRAANLRDGRRRALATIRAAGVPFRGCGAPSGRR